MRIKELRSLLELLSLSLLLLLVPRVVAPGDFAALDPDVAAAEGGEDRSDGVDGSYKSDGEHDDDADDDEGQQLLLGNQTKRGRKKGSRAKRVLKKNR